MERWMEFVVDDIAWLNMMWPGHADFDDTELPFRCVYTIRDDGRGNRYYRVRTADGRTRWNDLTGYEMSCLWDCQYYFDNEVQLVGCPDYCMAVESSDGFRFEYQGLKE